MEKFSCMLKMIGTIFTHVGQIYRGINGGLIPRIRMKRSTGAVRHGSRLPVYVVTEVGAKHKSKTTSHCVGFSPVI